MCVHVETRSSQSSKSSGGHILRSLGQVIVSWISQFVFLKMVTVDSASDTKHLSTSNYHSSKHNSALLVFRNIFACHYLLKKKNMKGSWLVS